MKQASSDSARRSSGYWKGTGNVSAASQSRYYAILTLHTVEYSTVQYSTSLMK